ncbi:hypothetical protein Golax_015076 [Gossypium laxum]|uniref:Uncharacterized protein n=1 Tax=Gossypium laxum TaxID=34288 RepID=A0A7J8ZWR1_9ROSI|nr:hypothetical protein [Gossypium laxum]
MMKSSNYFTIIMVICPIYSISRWTNTCFELWLNFGIPPIVALPLGRWICYLVWRSIQPCFVVRRFKLTRPILEPSMS